MNPFIQILAGWAILAVLMTGLWEWQRRRKNAAVVDVAWTAGVGALGVFFALNADGYPPRQWLVATLAAIWSLRLAGHLIRRVRGEREDGRYRALREKWGARTQLYLFFFFQIQAFWSVLFALPMMLAAWNPRPAWGVLDALGILIWMVSVAGEAVADRQLAGFRANPAHQGEVCRRGLWRYSRHPNYFFEWLHWWAWFLIGLPGPGGWWGLAGPAVMLLFLLKITGVPPTEAQALKSRGEAYREYQRTTSVLIPWPPKKKGF
jgi:steroid 5-alpha reductase family enzyme